MNPNAIIALGTVFLFLGILGILYGLRLAGFLLLSLSTMAFISGAITGGWFLICWITWG